MEAIDEREIGGWKRYFYLTWSSLGCSDPAELLVVSQRTGAYRQLFVFRTDKWPVSIKTRTMLDRSQARYRKLRQVGAVYIAPGDKTTSTNAQSNGNRTGHSLIFE